MFGKFELEFGIQIWRKNKIYRSYLTKITQGMLFAATIKGMFLPIAS